VSVVKPNDNAAIYTNGSTIYITAIGAIKSDGKRTITSCSLHDQRLRADPVSNHQRLRVGSGDAHLSRPGMPAPSGVTCASVLSPAERSSPLSITRAALTLEPSQRSSEMEARVKGAPRVVGLSFMAGRWGPAAGATTTTTRHSEIRGSGPHDGVRS